MSQPICRVGDIVTGVCQVSAPGHPRTFTGVWTTGSSTVIAASEDIVCVGDTGITDCGHTFIAVSGSDIVTSNGSGIVRVGDLAQVVGGGYGVAASGDDVVTS